MKVVQILRDFFLQKRFVPACPLLILPTLPLLIAIAIAIDRTFEFEGVPKRFWGPVFLVLLFSTFYEELRLEVYRTSLRRLVYKPENRQEDLLDLCGLAIGEDRATPRGNKAILSFYRSLSYHTRDQYFSILLLPAIRSLPCSLERDFFRRTRNENS